MTPEELLRQGKLDDCLKEVEKQVRANPSDAKLRVMLFQVLAVMGQWERAQTQLQVCAGMSPANLLMAQVGKQAILCEFLRAEVWAGKRSPLILGEPAEWLSWMVQALAMSAQGQHEGAAELRSKAFEAAPAVSGTIIVGETKEKPQPIEWIADADERLGPVLEALVDGKYYWIPWDRIALVKLDKPSDLRDTVWLPANFIWTAGGQSVGLIPARYPGTEFSSDAALRMGRRTEFIDDGGFERPMGQRLLATDAGEFGLLEVRSIRLGEGELNPLAEQPGNAAGLAMDSSLKPGANGGGGANG